MTDIRLTFWSQAGAATMFPADGSLRQFDAETIFHFLELPPSNAKMDTLFRSSSANRTGPLDRFQECDPPFAQDDFSFLL